MSSESKIFLIIFLTLFFLLAVIGLYKPIYSWWVQRQADRVMVLAPTLQPVTPNPTPGSVASASPTPPAVTQVDSNTGNQDSSSTSSPDLVTQTSPADEDLPTTGPTETIIIVLGSLGALYYYDRYRRAWNNLHTSYKKIDIL